MKRILRYQTAILDADQILLLQTIDMQDRQAFWLIGSGSQAGTTV